ncbi:rho GTPase-activating protein 32 [Colletes gigas]|uniref:rho GTPase-activating protein 32 n=1 Tax=Colletes gigas TaxID=935657 RepID=UPI001C9B7B12|nr:rho GTPase-activating protein 32 [Colletes gigas]XP_043262712.1 rho GTPase-activating protein 32 [Colletes gigas]XP_043262713.1 rho GTPase-activating protein 32 [Colletes gigas]
MPGPAQERPRAQRLTDIEPQTAKGLGCNRTDDFSTPVSSGSNMGSIARFPKLDECAHFHYEHVELSSLEVTLSEGSNDSDSYAVRVTSGDACWTLQRSYDNFVMFDKQLHRCIFDRKFSSLTKLPDARPKNTCDILRDYLNRFSQLNHEGLNCGPVLNWLQLDNRGRRILVPESDSCPINTPAVAAAYAVRPYVAQAPDEISFQVGDMISVIDMPPPGESTWWRGKHGFAVGFFPAECVAVIGDKVPRHLTVSTTVRSKLPVKPVLRKHGKLIAFFRSFILNRPSRRRLKQSGILKERVFGCDLGEHLLNSGQDVPTVLTCCAEFIENHGLVDGIYRLSGVTSNIQRLRNAFDEDRVPALHSDESILQDIHSVASLLKMYFRELPNPLCTYQLYSTFVTAVQANTDAERLRRMRDTVRKLPPPHYRTLEYLMRHLVRVAARGAETGMTPRNVAIVWAPNLLRCKELEVGGVAALQGVGVQAVVTEFLVCYAELIFGDGPVGRPKSLAITTSARLLSLEEARNRSLRGEPDYIEVGAGPAGLPLHYHTVIELPRKRNGSKRSPSLNWRALFSRGGLGARGKSRQVGTPPQTETVPSSLNSLRRLRPVKSADSLDGEDSLGPLLGPPPARPCGHSRSVSHDSYFDHLADAPNAASPLDLSEIQLNFDLEEREMRMFSEEESGGVASVEASPRRQRTEGTQNTTATGGSKRKRSRLEERLQCDVELRFIDSQSPDQVMVSADIHSMDTPSPLPTPGYLPLLSEASTPLTPATLHGTPHSVSPIPVNSPRISFRSFTLPLEIDDEQGNANKLNRTSVSSDKSSDPSHRLSVNLEGQNNAKSCERITSYDKRVDLYDAKESSNAQKILKESNLVVSDVVDQEMTLCDRLASHLSETDSTKITSPCKDADRSSSCPVDESKSSRSDTRDPLDVRKHDAPNSKSVSSQNDDAIAGNSNAHRNELSGLPLSNATDLDSPMSYEQTIEDLPDSGFVICDSSDKMFTNTETPQMATNTNDSGEWVIVERTGSITTPTSESSSPKDPLDGTVNPAIATDAPQLRSISENVSRTSLDLTMGSTVDTDTSCIGVSDLTESPVLPQESGEMTFDVADNRELGEHAITAQRTAGSFDGQANFRLGDSGNNFSNIVHSSMHDQDNGNQKMCTVSITDVRLNQKSTEMDHEVTAYYNQLDNAKTFNKNDSSTKKNFGNEEAFDNSQRTSRSLDFQQQDIRRSLQLHRKPQFQSADCRSFTNLSNKYQDLELSLANADNNKQRCQNQKLEKCQSFEYVSPKEPAKNNQQHKQLPTCTDENSKCNNVKTIQRQEQIEMVIPSENAAEPSEIAHHPEGASETTSLDSSCSFSNASSPVDDSIVLRDTAAILQELALQRLSGGMVGDLSIPPRRRYEAESNRDRRSFDSEIGREIVRERKMRQELDTARGKSEEPPVNNAQHLPPCLRARHARATRASLSRSLDEAKFNKMTEEACLPVKQATEDAQHSSTPNVGASSNNSRNSDKSNLKNLGGLDLGDPQCRERIEKYKEERRTFLRDKYRSESFRGMLSKAEDDGEQALLTRLKQRASRPSLH